MTAFELVEPSSLDEALELLDPDDPAVRPIAGGTALMLMMKTGLYRPRRLVSLRARAGAHHGRRERALSHDRANRRPCRAPRSRTDGDKAGKAGRAA